MDNIEFLVPQDQGTHEFASSSVKNKPVQMGCLDWICLILLNMPTLKTPIHKSMDEHPFIITGRETDNFSACKSSECDKLYPRGAISLYGQ